jgi:hypothetical protein
MIVAVVAKLRYYHGIFLEGPRETTKNPIRIAGVLAEVRTNTTCSLLHNICIPKAEPYIGSI